MAFRLADRKGKARILARSTGAKHGNFGDCAPIGEGVSEMRIHFGPGYKERRDGLRVA
jgi:putative addiction module killer protein